jgi:hypothetical protein
MKGKKNKKKIREKKKVFLILIVRDPSFSPRVFKTHTVNNTKPFDLSI